MSAARLGLVRRRSTPVTTLLRFRPFTSSSPTSTSSAPSHRTVSATQQPSRTHTTLTPTQQNQILAIQRLNRPVSPHLTIYQPQINSISSALQRNTGIVLSGGMYVFGIAYAVNSLLPLTFAGDVTAGTVALTASLGALGSGAAGWAGKGLLAWMGAFHTVNGVLGLVRGTRGVSLERTLGERGRFVKVGWWVMGISSVGALGLLAWF